LLALLPRKKFLGEIRSERILLINTLNFVHIFEMDAHFSSFMDAFIYRYFTHPIVCLHECIYYPHKNVSCTIIKVVGYLCTLLPNQELAGGTGKLSLLITKEWSEHI
jgi:hypothetical protein